MSTSNIPPEAMTVVVTTDQYVELRDAQLRLRALERAGVDNWDGYEHAMDILCRLRVNNGLSEYEGDDE
jgi:hypothetical protein